VTGQIFISYSSADRQYVDRLAGFLRSHGLTVWYDPDIRPGAGYVHVIEEALTASAAVLLVMTKAAKASQWVQAESEAARAHHKPVIPILLEDGATFLQYQSTQIEDVRGWRMPSLAVVTELQRLASGGAARGPEQYAVPPQQRQPVMPPPTQPPVRPAPPAKRRGISVAGVFAVVILLALCGGGIWVGPMVWSWASDRIQSVTGGLPGGGSGGELVERLVSRKDVPFGAATFTVTSVKTNEAKTVVTMTADNSGNGDALQVWNCCILVEQPNNRQRERSAFSAGGDFPDAPHTPIPARTAVTGTIEFEGSIDRGATGLVLTMEVASGTGLPSSVQFDNLALKSAE
jgi:hypothetical protein